MSRAPSQAGEPVTQSARTARLDQRILAVTEAVGLYIESWGFRSIHGRVWALLAMRRTPMSQAEIADTLGVSRSLVNLAIAELTERGLVRAADDSRQSPYEATMDVWPAVTDVLRAREWMLVERARVALEAALAEVEFAREAGASTPYDARRIRVLLVMTEFAQTVLRAVLAVRVPRALEPFGAWLSRSGKVLEALIRRL